MDNEAHRLFAIDLSKAKGWNVDDGYFDHLLDAIEKGSWNFEFKVWILGRDSVLNELKNAGHSMGQHIKNHNKII